MAIKSRIFNIMQYENHPETGEPLLSLEKIKDALAHRTIKRWAYVRHDKDVYSALDEEQDAKHVKGEPKPAHWHICIEMGSNQVEVGIIAKWFGIKDNYVNVAKGHGAFLDCVEYLTHEDAKQRELGKHRYEDAEISTNFDFRKELDRRNENKLKYGKELNERDQMRYDVLYHGKTLKQCKKEDRLLYMEDMDKLKKLRLEYISEMAPPSLRINYYVQGRGGLGKGLMCRALARNLYPQYEDDSDIFFEVGAKGAAFEGYDGQPVIIWNDRRAIDLLQELNGRGNVFNVFDTHPTKQKQNIKYGSINLCNCVNIVNSVQPYNEFLDGLAGEYKDKDGNLQEVEDKGQSYRRFPFMILLHEEDFDLMLNKGFMYNTNEYEEYEKYEHICANMQRIAEKCKGENTPLGRKYMAQAVQLVTDKHAEVEGSMAQAPVDEDELSREFANLGMIPKQMTLDDYVDVDFKEVDADGEDDYLPFS